MLFEIEFDKALSPNATEIEPSSAYSTAPSSHRVKLRNEKDYYKILEIDKSSTIESGVSEISKRKISKIIKFSLFLIRRVWLSTSVANVLRKYHALSR